MGIPEGLRFLVLDYLPMRYALVLIDEYTGDLQLWDIDASFSRARFRDSISTHTIVNEGDPLPTFLPGQRLLFLGGSSLQTRRPQVWDTVSRRPLFELDHYRNICGVSPDGEWVVASEEETGSVMWSASSGWVRWQHTFWCDAASFSPSGDMVALVARKNTIILKSTTGECMCSSRWVPGTSRTSKVVLTDSSLDVHDLWSDSRSVSYSLHRKASGCELVEQANRKGQRQCDDIVVAGGVKLTMQVTRCNLCIRRIDGGGRCTRLDAGPHPCDYRGGRLSPNGRSAVFWTTYTDWLWHFEGGGEPQQLPNLAYPYMWTYSEDGEVLVTFVAFADRNTSLAFIDVASGLEIPTWINPEAKPNLQHADLHPSQRSVRLSGLRYWGASSLE